MEGLRLVGELHDVPLTDIVRQFLVETVMIAVCGGVIGLLVGVGLCALGSAYIIMSGIGVRIMDLVALTLVKRFRWRFTSAKMIFEVGFISGALLLNGPVGIGTFAFVLLVGLLIAPMMYCGERFLRLRNYSLTTPQRAPRVTTCESQTRA